MSKPNHNPSVEFRAAALGYEGRVALRDITLAFRRGSSTALVGPNGSGKTTLLHAVAGLIKPTRGSVVVDDESTPVACVLQRADEHRWMPLTVAEVLRMGRYRRAGLLGRITRRDRRCIRDAARRLAVDHLLRREYGTLSGGERQRVLVAQALVQEPSTLLLDEPVTGLDLPSQQRILGVIDDESDGGTTVVFSTHHLDEARHADRVALLAGRLVAHGSPDDVLTTDNLAAAFHGELVTNDRAPGEPVAAQLFDEHGHGTDHEQGADRSGP